MRPWVLFFCLESRANGPLKLFFISANFCLNSIRLDSVLCSYSQVASVLPKLPSECVVSQYHLKQAVSLLCAAFEGGSNDWCLIERYIKPRFFAVEVAEYAEFLHLAYPVSPGGALLISDQSGETLEHVGKLFRLSPRSLKRGWAIMAEKYPRHFADVLLQNDDVVTGDVFLQCCLFGEIIYG